MSFCSQDQGHRLALMDEIFKDMTKEGLKCVVKVKVAQLCPTLCNPMDYTAHGILQARILEWITFPFAKGYYQSRE